MTLTYETTLVDGREISVDYSVTSWGAPATWDDPAEGVEIDVEGAFLDGVDFSIWLDLSDEDREGVEAEILEQLERDGPPDDNDPYD